jgi:hypothetical protein
MIIATTTALAYPRDTPNMADVCIVRLLISQYLPVDVNLDLVINQTDVNIVEDSLYYNFNVQASSTCPQNNDLQRMCGRADVNFDGSVNQLDATAITQSAALGTRVPCGGVYATAFSCGSTRRAPLTPAVDISFDSIVYFNNDGLFGTTTPLSPAKRRAETERTVMETILVDFEHMHSELETLRNTVGVVDQKVESKSDRQEVVAVRQEVQAARKEFRAEFGSVASRVQHHDRVLSSGPASPRELFAAISVTVGAIALCGAIAHALARR